MEKALKTFLEIAGLIAIIVTIWAGLDQVGVFDSSDVRIFRSATSNLINDNQPYFELGFQNLGERDTELCVNISSNNLNFTFEENRKCFELKKETPLERYVPFRFDINSSNFEDENGNITINMYAIHKSGLFKRPVVWSEDYTFIEKCTGYSGCFYHREIKK